MNPVADFFVRITVVETTRSDVGNLQSFLVKSAETRTLFSSGGAGSTGSGATPSPR